MDMPHRNCQLADWRTHGLDKSQTGELADMLARVVTTVAGVSSSSPVCDLSSPSELSSL